MIENMDARMLSTRKWLAYVLRQGSTESGLQKRPGGWIKMTEVEGLKRASDKELFEILMLDKEGQFQTFGNKGEFWVRAVTVSGTSTEEEPHRPVMESCFTPPKGTGWNGHWVPSLRPCSPVWRGSWVGPW